MTVQHGLLSVKIGVIGDPGVGKTSLIECLVANHQGSTHRSKLDITVNFEELRIGEEQTDESSTVVLVIVDVEYSSYYERELDAMLPDFAGAVVVGDITQPDSVYHLARYLRRLERLAPNAPIAFAVNKTDLPRHPEITVKGLSFIADAVGIDLFFTSAKTGAGVDDLFRSFAVKLATSSI